jgi:hypothetical protein
MGIPQTEESFLSPVLRGNTEMAKKDEWLVTHIVTAERIPPKEEGLGFLGWTAIIFVGLMIVGWLMGGH